MFSFLVTGSSITCWPLQVSPARHTQGETAPLHSSQEGRQMFPCAHGRTRGHALLLGLLRRRRSGGESQPSRPSGCLWPLSAPWQWLREVADGARRPWKWRLVPLGIKMGRNLREEAGAVLGQQVEATVGMYALSGAQTRGLSLGLQQVERPRTREVCHPLTG